VRLKNGFRVCEIFFINRGKGNFGENQRVGNKKGFPVKYI
jgi:hypothetical protein